MESLRTLLWASTKIWELRSRGLVVKCTDEIAAKFVSHNKDFTEYTAMQYLAEHAPDIPAPRPHGLVIFGHYQVTFMSYIPSMTLADAWAVLSHEQRISIQFQSDAILRRLRTLRKPEGHALGGAAGEGVKDHRRGDYPCETVVDTASGYQDFLFSIPHRGSKTYAEFIRRLWPSSSAKGSVFTHGDIQPANTMVELKENGSCMVTGIIDWEDSGFYPEHHESTQVTKILNMIDENDWYLYLPPCIAPSSFPMHWLVDRLWDDFYKLTTSPI